MAEGREEYGGLFRMLHRGIQVRLPLEQDQDLDHSELICLVQYSFLYRQSNCREEKRECVCEIIKYHHHIIIIIRERLHPHEDVRSRGEATCVQPHVRGLFSKLTKKSHAHLLFFKPRDERRCLDVFSNIYLISRVSTASMS